MWESVLVALVIAGCCYGVYRFGRGLARMRAGRAGMALHSLPGHYGLYAALWCAAPCLAVGLLWLLARGPLVDHVLLAGLDEQFRQTAAGSGIAITEQIRAVADGAFAPEDVAPDMLAAARRYTILNHNAGMAALALALLLMGVAGWVACRRITPAFPARHAVERAMTGLMIACSVIAVLTTLGIVLSLLFEAIRFFGRVPITDFLFGLEWAPQTALRGDQVAGEGRFGAVPIFAGTLLITLIAMLTAAPVGLMAAIYMSEYARPATRMIVKPLLEILAGIPTVVYGFFAALTVAPFFRGAGEAVGLDIASESALAAGVVMGVMIIPFVSSLSDDVMSAVPRELRDGSLAIGATRSETIRRVVLPAALPGVAGALLLAVSRAIGETMIVVMAAGLAANLSANPFAAVTTVTVQIVTLLVGDQEFDSAKTLAAFALGLTLFVVTLALNVLALYIVRKYRERYD